MLITLKFLKWGPLRNVKLWRRSPQVFVILMLQGCLVFAQQKVIVIDPGHGGKDSGTIGINGLQEKEVVLKIAKEILRLNKTLFRDKFDIYSTRYTDTLISLSDRTKLVNTLKADVFVSLHCNHSDNPDANGIEVYVGSPKSWNSKESTWLAYLFQTAFTERLGFKSRGVKYSNLQVLRETGNQQISLLLELGFLSNFQENRYYNNVFAIRAVALLVMECLIKI